MTTLDCLKNTDIINSEISLIQEEDSREITSIYDSNEENNDVLKYDLKFDHNNCSVNSPMQLKRLSLSNTDNEEEYSENLFTNATNSRLTSTNSQFSDCGKSVRNSYSEFSDCEEIDDGKKLIIPKLRSPFSLKNDAEMDISTNATNNSNNPVNTVPKKKRNRSLRWSYQGQIDTINEVQKKNAIHDTQQKLLANDTENIETTVPLKKLHKRTTSLPYSTSIRIDTNLNNESSSSNMISLKKRLSPSSFFKPQDDRELKIKQQEQKIKHLELENLKQFSHIQELKLQTSYCIKEIELLKETKKPIVENIQKKKSSTQIFKTLALVAITIILIIYFYPEIKLQQKSFYKIPISNSLDFFPENEQLWYSITKKTQNFDTQNNSLWEKIKLQIELIKLVYKNSKYI